MSSFGAMALLWTAVCLGQPSDSGEIRIAREIDRFEAGAVFALSPGSAVAIQIREGAGYEASNGLQFMTEAKLARGSAFWPIQIEADSALVFRAKNKSGRNALLARLIESDGDTWTASVRPGRDWRWSALPMAEFEFLGRGDGAQAPAKIDRLELEGALSGPGDKAFAIDDIGVAARGAYEAWAAPEDSLIAIAQAVREMRSLDPNLLRAFNDGVASDKRYADGRRMRQLQTRLEPILQFAINRCYALDVEYRRRLSLNEGAAEGFAAFDRRDGALARQALEQSAARLRQFDERPEAIERAVLLARRATQKCEDALGKLDLALTPSFAPAAPAPGGQAAGAAGQRARALINGDWTFRGEGSTAGFSLPVPHGFWGQTVGDIFPAAPGADAKAASGWLSRRLAIPVEWRGRRIALEFSGAGHVVEALVNGLYCGGHIGGFDPFSIDISGAAVPGAENEILLRVTGSAATRLAAPNPLISAEAYSMIRPGSGPNDYLAMGGPDGLDAGIWDDVYLRATPWARIERISIRTFTRGSRLEARAFAVNETAAARAFQLRATVFDGVTPVFETLSDTARMEPGASRTLLAEGEWAGGEPWGPAAPYGQPKLYWLRLRLEENGQIVDEAFERFGFRQFEILSTGFFLNGKRIALQCDTISASDGGATWERANPWFFAQYLAEARRAGVNCVILESPAPASWLDLCDETGMLCAPAAPIFGLLDQAPPDLYGLDDCADPIWLDHAKTQMAAWARGHMNHPSAVFRVSETGSFYEDVFWAHGGGAPSQARKTRERLAAAFEIDRAIRAVDPSRPVLHLSADGAAFDPRFEAYSATAPLDAESWRRGAAGRPLAARLRWPGGGGAGLEEAGLRAADSAKAMQALSRGTEWIQKAAGQLRENDTPAIVAPPLRAGLFSTARRSWMGPWNALAPQALAPSRAETSAWGPTAWLPVPIAIAWPCYSGTGTRARQFDLAAGISTWINWFEPKTPRAAANPWLDALRGAWRPQLALAAGERAEAVAMAGAAGGPGAIVFARPADGIGEIEGVAADFQGRAWFVLRRPGTRYLAVGREPAAAGDPAAFFKPTPSVPAPGFWHIPAIEAGL